MPNLYIIGGPNGAGKTTAALKLLPDMLACYEFVNADLIAAGLSPLRPEALALQSGRLMIERLNQLAASGVDFAFEMTLASHSLEVIEKCRATGYIITLLYLWLNSPELAIARVAQRVRSGGHTVPEVTIRRRYEAGRRNFLSLYMPLADKWLVYDNSAKSPILIAKSALCGQPVIAQPEVWNSIVNP